MHPPPPHPIPLFPHPTRHQCFLRCIHPGYQPLTSLPILSIMLFLFALLQPINLQSSFLIYPRPNCHFSPLGHHFFSAYFYFIPFCLFRAFRKDFLCSSLHFLASFPFVIPHLTTHLFSFFSPHPPFPPSYAEALGAATYLYFMLYRPHQ